LNLDALTAQLRVVMPTLDKNLETALAECHADKLSLDGYRHVLERHTFARKLLDQATIPARQAYQACAWLTLDLRSGMHEMPAGSELFTQYAAWWKCFVDAGFTETNPDFEIPALPSA
jgi:hypothetical protein